MKYIYLTNEAKDAKGRSTSMMDGYVEGDPLKLAYEGILEGVVPLYANDQLFEKFNIDHPADYRGRSMSKGDVIFYPEPYEAYAVEGLGWKKIAVPVSVCLAGNPTVEGLPCGDPDCICNR